MRAIADASAVKQRNAQVKKRSRKALASARAVHHECIRATPGHCAIVDGVVIALMVRIGVVGGKETCGKCGLREGEAWIAKGNRWELATCRQRHDTVDRRRRVVPVRQNGGGWPGHLGACRQSGSCVVLAA
jgi:hypothetical protein